MTITATKASWYRMRRRCRLGLRWYEGVQVCERWKESFDAFLADMGERPVGHTLDRIDSSKGYEPGNCRWATPKEQSVNRRGPLKPTRVLSIGDQSDSIAGWSARSGVARGTITKRVDSGWPASDAVWTPSSAQHRAAAKARHGRRPEGT